MQSHLTVPVKHVSHTAWLVAAFRAQETEREDAHFNDPLAKKLLGDLEVEYLSRFPETALKDYWLLTVRTWQIDRLILKAVQGGVKTILNLGAGLDTRPYRLNLPPDLLWIEVDYSDLIGYKNERLVDERPRCNLKRVSADLSQPEERKKVFEMVDHSSNASLVLTEGLLGYLTKENVTELAEELADHSFKYWLMDVFNGSFKDLTDDIWHLEKSKYEEDDVKIGFIPEDMASFLDPLGWQLNDFLSFAQGALDLNRFPVGVDAQSIQKKGLMESGVCLFVPKENQRIAN